MSGVSPKPSPQTRATTIKYAGFWRWVMNRLTNRLCTASYHPWQGGIHQCSRTLGHPGDHVSEKRWQQ